MITKAGQHDTDRAGRLIFTKVFQDLNFVVNPTTDDYGIDYNVQAFEEQHPSGAWFHVQLKSSSALQFSADGTTISYSLDMDHLVHYGMELKQPIFLILVDVALERLFFFSPQLVAKQIGSAQAAKKDSLTVKIPIGCELPANARSLLETLKKLYLILSSRELLSSSATDFQRTIAAMPDQEALYRSFQEKNDLLRLERIHSDFRAGRVVESLRRADTVQNDPDASIAVRFHAVMQMNAIEWQTSLRAGTYGPALAESTFEYARRVRALIRPGYEWLQFASMIIGVSARLEALILGDGADYMTLQQHLHARTNPIVVLGLYARRTATAKRIVRVFNQGVRLARLAAKYSDRWALASLLPRIPLALAPYLVSLRSSSDAATEKIFVDSSLSILNLSMQIANELGNERVIATTANAALSLCDKENSPAFQWCQDQVRAMPDGDDKTWALGSIQRSVDRRRGIPQEGDYNPDPNWQIIQKIALSVKVDISDENSLLVRRLRIAVKDDSPETMMRSCEHLVLTLGAVSPTARYITEVFGLSTSANKVIHCNLLGHHEEGVDADSAFAKFSKLHCHTCKYMTPRDESWTYSLSVRQAFEQENLTLVKRAVEAGIGLRLTDVDDLDVPPKIESVAAESQR